MGESAVKEYGMQGEEQIAKMSEIHHFDAAELDRLKIIREGGDNQEVLTSYRDLRAQLLARSEGKNFTCLVTSVRPRGGATHISRNLAAAIALDKTKTATIVDCNFYDPTQDALLSTDINVGLADFLNSKDMGVEYIVYASGIPRVRVIPAGKNSRVSAERISTPKMQHFIKEVKSRYRDRYIVIDSPCANEYPADVRVLAQLVDFVVLVVPYGMAKSNQVLNCIKTIGEDKLAGVVFNEY